MSVDRSPCAPVYPFDKNNYFPYERTNERTNIWIFYARGQKSALRKNVPFFFKTLVRRLTHGGWGWGGPSQIYRLKLNLHKIYRTVPLCWDVCITAITTRGTAVSVSVTGTWVGETVVGCPGMGGCIFELE